MGLSCYRTLQPHPQHGALQHLALKNAFVPLTLGLAMQLALIKAMWVKVPVLNFGLHR